MNNAPRRVQRTVVEQRHSWTKECANNAPCSFPANWRSQSVTAFFTRAQNIVFQHKINSCVDVEHMVRFPCVWLCFICVLFKITHINIAFVCVYFEFTLLASTR